LLILGGKMARYTGPKNRLSRREGLDLFGKGNKLRRAGQHPGQHGPKGTKRRPSDFGVQLREKQKAKRFYGIMESQFRKYFEKAAQYRGTTGEKLLQLLEARLDNVVYRLGFAPTRAMARQLTSHGHVLVDGQKVTIPSFQVKVGQSISLDTTAQNIPAIKVRIENRELTTPEWLSREAIVGQIVRLPKRLEIEAPVNEQLIVEFYSR